MAKQKQTEKQLTRRQMARREKEHQAQRLITWIAIGTGIVILAILIYGVVTEVFIEARRPVAQVGDATITTRDFEARQRYERWMTQLEVYQYQSYLDQIAASQPPEATPDATGESPETTPEVDDGMSDLIQQLQLQVASLERQLSPEMASLYAGGILDSMIEEELVRQEAATRGLTVTEDEVQERVGLILGYDPSATETVTDTVTSTELPSETDALTETESLTETAVPTPAPMDFDELYAQFETNVLKVTRYSEDDFRAMVRAGLLKEQLQAELAEEVEPVQDQVETILFSAETEEDAQAIEVRINDEGADPEALVEEYGGNEDPSTSATALPWLPLGYLGSQLGMDMERVAFNTPVGKASDPVLGQDGRYYVVYVTGHEERELTENLMAQAGEQAYQGWLSSTKDARAEYLEWEGAVVTD